MKFNKSSALTMQDLINYIGEAQKEWTKQDTEFLGPFEAQQVNVIHPEGGISTAYAEYTGHGFILFPMEE